MAVITLLLTTPTAIESKAQTNKTMYATATVNVRTKPTTKSKSVGTVHWNGKVRVVKKINKKWYQIKYRGKVRYISAKYIKKKKAKYKTLSVPTTSSSFKSYEDESCITDSKSIPQGKIKSKYHLDSKTGIYMIGDRYCVAVGSGYCGHRIGVKIDLVLSHNGRKHTLKCITADSKADKDTVNNHRVHTDGSVAEFIVKTSALPSTVKRMGDISYASSAFKGKIIQIRVYK